MILKGAQRGGAKALAVHLLNAEDNDFVELHELRGFLAEDLTGAFKEVQAIAGGTRCRQPFFSVSLSPPPGAKVSVEMFEDAVARIEAANGLQGQPRAIVFHEKDGRRHAHAVWSRIDAETMTARNLPHFKNRLQAVAHGLFLAHRWEIPKGFADRAQSNPANVTLPEGQEAKRQGANAIDRKVLIQRCWAASDSRAGLVAALSEHGFVLARGERRSHVVVAPDGQVMALARAIGCRTKEVRARLGEADDLPDVEAARAQAASLTEDFSRAAQAQASDRGVRFAQLDAERAAMVSRHRAERQAFDAAQQERRAAEARARHRRARRGIIGAWDRMTGRRARETAAAIEEAKASRARNLAERAGFIADQLAERRELETRRTALRREALGLIDPTESNRTRLLEKLNAAASEAPAPKLRPAFDPRQPFRPKPKPQAISADEIRRDPSKALTLLSHSKARFTEADIVRTLAEHFPAPEALRRARAKALACPNLVRLTDAEGGFTTRDFVATEAQLRDVAAKLARMSGFAVSRAHEAAALRRQDDALRARIGAGLSAEQRQAAAHLLGAEGLACMVGLAGAGKSTILAAAQDAWSREGVRVHGAALSGKAAAGLEKASGIPSRTLASLELSWANGRAPLAAGDVLVIDEAGMIGTRQLARVARKVQEIGAKLVLVGDPDQLPPIEAGEPFRDLLSHHGAARLTEIHRQTADWQRQATRLLAEGRIGEAAKAYAEHGALSRTTRQGEAVAALAADYLADRAERGPDVSRLALAYRRRDVHALNQAIRGALRAENALPEGTLLATSAGQREISPGDRLVFTRNDRDIDVKNGGLGTVITVDATRVTVRLDDDGGGLFVAFDPRGFDGFEHGYAVTIHKSQGVTVDRCFVLASRRMGDSLAYVAMTRHREALKIYAAETDRPEWSRDDPRDRLMKKLTRPRPGLRSARIDQHSMGPDLEL